MSRQYCSAFLNDREESHTCLAPSRVSDKTKSLSMLGIALKDRKKRRNGTKMDGENNSAPFTSIGREGRVSESGSVLYILQAARFADEVDNKLDLRQQFPLHCHANVVRILFL